MPNYADLKPLDCIGFTGRHFLKNAPTIDFYFFGGYFLVRGIEALKSPNSALTVRRSTVRKHLCRHPRAELKSADECLFFKYREQFVPAFAAERELFFLFFC